MKALKDIFGNKKLEDFGDVQTGYALLEAGEYIFTLERADLKDARTGGKYINVMFRQANGNKCLFNNFNVVHADTGVQERGQAEFATVLKVCGFDEIPDDLDEAIGRELKLQVGQKVTKDSQAAIRRNPQAPKEMENYIVKYLSVSESPTEPTNTAGVSTPPKPPAGVTLPSFG